jgi:hypothetical protein
MFDYLSKKLTKNYDEIPLFFVTFNYNKYKKYGARGSCDLKLHPSLKDDEYIKKQLENIVDHIRHTQDMDDIK